MTHKIYRKLTPQDISQLERQGCRSGEWDLVEVSDGFDPEYIRNAFFRGRIRIGATGREITNRDGVTRRSGIYNAEIIDCTAGDGVFISGIGSYISNYDIGEDAYIEAAGKIVCTGRGTFGNGVEVAVLNEGGGREVPIFDGLTAQTAYITTMYRHRPALIATMKKMVDAYTASLDPRRGVIGRGASITDCITIRDVRIGENAVVAGASELSNGTLNSTPQSPVFIGAGVKARDFICAPGSHVDNGVIMERAFVGEACHLDYGFTAIDALFFANSHCANGEATSVFAGPYTVSHHRSSLLIAGYFLFFNAGSGSNQSNHLFRAGAVHQGIHERGVKFGSDSYVMLPAREGAYSVVVGKHRSHHDTTDFPYSYLIEDEGCSQLVPAANFINYGTMRDLEKWPKRDGRGAVKSDLINFSEYTPYIGNKLVRAIELCEQMLARKDVKVFNYERTRIRRASLARGLKIYRQALDALLGTMLAGDFQEKMPADTDWIDMAGMIAPRGEVERILDQIESGKLAAPDSIVRELETLHNSYSAHAWAWAVMRLGQILGHEPTPSEIADAVTRGGEAAGAIEAGRRHNALQDSSTTMAVGYGIDAVTKDERDADFCAVRGTEIQ